jgi:hypothetical protein
VITYHLNSRNMSAIEESADDILPTKPYQFARDGSRDGYGAWGRGEMPVLASGRPKCMSRPRHAAIRPWQPCAVWRDIEGHAMVIPGP